MAKLYEIDAQTNIDEFGVDHSNFSLRDEIEYNFRRAEEKEMQQSRRVNAYNNDYVSRMAPQQGVENQQSMLPRVVSSNFQQYRPNTELFSPGEIAWSAAEGMGQGIVGSLEHSANTASGGIYDILLNEYGDNGYEKRQKALEALAAQENLQKPLKYLNYLNDFTINTYVGSKFKVPAYLRSLYKKMK